MRLPQSRKLQVALGVAGAILIGALGSGLWDLLKPALFWLLSGALDVATLGLASLRDAMYAEIARGSYERAGTLVLSLLTGLLTGALSIALFVGARRNRSASATSEPLPRALRWAALFVVGSFIPLMIFQQIQAIYVVSAANRIEQLEREIAPFVGEHERLVFASRFAAVRTRAEYVALQSEMAVIARKNNLDVSDFGIY